MVAETHLHITLYVICLSCCNIIFICFDIHNLGSATCGLLEALRKTISIQSANTFGSAGQHYLTNFRPLPFCKLRPTRVTELVFVLLLKRLTFINSEKPEICVQVIVNCDNLRIKQPTKCIKYLKFILS